MIKLLMLTGVVAGVVAGLLAAIRLEDARR